MKCDVENLNMYMDGMLTEEEILEVDAHLEICKGCKDYLKSLQEMTLLFPLLEETNVPRDFAPRVMIEIAKSTPQHKTSIWIPILAITTLVYTQLSIIFSLTIKDTIEILNWSTEVMRESIVYFSQTSQILMNLISAVNIIANALIRVYQDLAIYILLIGGITILLQYILFMILKKNRQFA